MRIRGQLLAPAREQRAPVLEDGLTLSQLLYLSKLICNHICFKRTIHITVNSWEKLFPSLRPRKLESPLVITPSETHWYTHTQAWPFVEASHLNRQGHKNFCNDVKHLQLFWQHNGAYCALLLPWRLQRSAWAWPRADKGGTEWKLGYMWSTKLLIRLKWIPSACCLTRQERRRRRRMGVEKKKGKRKRGRTIGHCLLMREQRKSLF